jgi:NAD(P)-dependent dehydrogenase (short-subunit alcohol dehydrogenase family)
MNERMNSILSADRVAVITGAQQGIGAEIARRLSERGMRLALVDLDQQKLNTLASTLKGDAITIAGDITQPDVATALHDRIRSEFGSVSLLVNNAGIKDKAGPWDAPAVWQKMLDVNFWAALRMQSLFVPEMIASGNPAAILNVGSKEGITCPPGHAGYSVSKAAIKVLTEQLEHELRNATAGRISAHLLVPGYTWTPMNAAGQAETGTKPDGAWTTAALLNHALPRLLDGDFYIVCPDEEVTQDMDRQRIRWAWNDIIENRPALSRWHPDWAPKFKAWASKEGLK